MSAVLVNAGSFVCPREGSLPRLLNHTVSCGCFDPCDHWGYEMCVNVSLSLRLGIGAERERYAHMRTQLHPPRRIILCRLSAEFLAFFCRSLFLPPFCRVSATALPPFCRFSSFRYACERTKSPKRTKKRHKGTEARRRGTKITTRTRRSKRAKRTKRATKRRKRTTKRATTKADLSGHT